MTPVVYIGTSDERILTSADLASLGVDRKEDLVFRQGEPVEVSEELADILLERHTAFAQEFREYEAPPPRKRAGRVAEKVTGKASDDIDPTAVEQPPAHVENAPTDSAESGDAGTASKSKARRSS
jgi:hypothetical protein